MSAEARSAVVLLVEDDPNDVLFLKRAFKKAGVTIPVRVLHDGQEAIDYLSRVGRFQDPEQHPTPCLVVLDLKLPKRTGLEVLQWLRRREEFSDLPVVMVTSSGEVEDRARVMDHGVEAYHVKPVTFDELVGLARLIRVEVEDHCKDAAPCPPQEGERGR
jgi:DNA-binding response OmpR family regulator